MNLSEKGWYHLNAVLKVFQMSTVPTLWVFNGAQNRPVAEIKRISLLCNSSLQLTELPFLLGFLVHSPLHYVVLTSCLPFVVFWFPLHKFWLFLALTWTDMTYYYTGWPKKVWFSIGCIRCFRKVTNLPLFSVPWDKTRRGTGRSLCPTLCETHVNCSFVSVDYVIYFMSE